MKHSEFTIGEEFTCGRNLWRCTDKGTRVICAIKIEETIECTITDANGNHKAEIRKTTEDDYIGPPYKVTETVFDEYDFDGCYKKKESKNV